MRYTCSAHVPQNVRDAAPIVRFTDRNGNLYYSYIGYTRRFGQNTDWLAAATQLDQWIRTGPEHDEPAERRAEAAAIVASAGLDNVGRDSPLRYGYRTARQPRSVNRRGTVNR